jgi:hypothetical protein
VSATALLDIDVKWLYSAENGVLSCKTHLSTLENAILEENPTAVYITSPDYLGGVEDVKSIAEICHRHGVILLVDNAHGAYLKMLEPSCHPIDLGADMCSDSAHKTLPCVTGGAYLHISRSLNESYKTSAKRALELFGSTSPSYLTLASLDRTNRYIEKFKRILPTFISKIDATKHRLTSAGYTLVGDEPMKIHLKWINTADVESLGLRLEILNLEDVAIGTYILYDFYSGKKGETAEMDVELDISMIMDSEYKTFYTFFNKSETGGNTDLDCVPGLCFQKTMMSAEHKWIWRPKNWGYLQLPSPAIKNFKTY